MSGITAGISIGPDQAVTEILERGKSVPDQHSLLVGISGIDGSGKGYITARLAEKLRSLGQKTATINIDGWLNLPVKRFNPDDPARHFYLHALRFSEMFSQLVLPLKKTRNVDLLAKSAEETATEFRDHHYSYHDIDIILLEGIYLFQRRYRNFFDLAIWLECSFETALNRAIERSQEGLPPEETRRAYNTIYFPAQEIHFAKDDPKGSADFIILNE